MSAEPDPAAPLPASPQADPLQAGPLLGRGACIDALRAGLLAMADDPSGRQLLWRDHDFELWPLDEPEVLDALGRWLRLPGRSITLLAADFDTLARQKARFATWRRPRSHLVHAFRPAQWQAADLGGLLLGSARAVQLLDRLHWRGRIVDEPATLVDFHQQCDALMQRSEAAWPATTLGL